MKHVAIPFIVLAAALIAGCGEADNLKRAPITGLVTAMGTPIGGAAVQFTPVSGTAGAGAIGIADQQGKFTVISSRRKDEGIPPGDYLVRVSRFADPDGTLLSPEATQAEHPDAKETVPAPYSGFDSPLKVTIGKEGGEVKVDVPMKLLEWKKK